MKTRIYEMNGSRTKLFVGETEMGIGKLKRGMQFEFEERLLTIRYVEFTLLIDDTELAEIIVT